MAGFYIQAMIVTDCRKMGRASAAVSYTHLDVYKRQALQGLGRNSPFRGQAEIWSYWPARNFSASSAAMQPIPAEVTAWR